jgi:integrase
MPSAQKSITRAVVTPLKPRPRAGGRGPRPPGPPLPRYLTQDELQRFRRAVAAEDSLRDVALFGLMYRFGLRAVEATRLLVEDLDLARTRIRLRRAKGGDAKEYPLPRDLMPALRRYLRQRADRGPFLLTVPVRVLPPQEYVVRDDSGASGATNAETLRESSNEARRVASWSPKPTQASHPRRLSRRGLSIVDLRRSSKPPSPLNTLARELHDPRAAESYFSTSIFCVAVAPPAWRR